MAILNSYVCLPQSIIYIYATNTARPWGLPGLATSVRANQDDDDDDGDDDDDDAADDDDDDDDFDILLKSYEKP